MNKQNNKTKLDSRLANGLDKTQTLRYYFFTYQRWYMLIDSVENVHQKGKPRMKHSFSKLDAALARNQISNAWSRRNFNMNNNEEWSASTRGLAPKPKKNRITENVDFFESKDREIWPVLTGNQTPCRWRLPVTDFQSQEVRNLCLISIQNARKMCLVGLVETWTALSRKTEQPDPDLTGNQIPCRLRRALGWGEPGSDC